jgi:ppGpp synthetase/RelA/SpoT-type nucleotidyltranferase
VRELKAVLLTLYLHFYDEVTPGVDQLMAAWRTRDDAPAARWGAAPGAEAGDVARPGASAAAEGSSVRETRVPLATHVEAFRRIRPRYERFAESLRTILEAVAQRRAPLAIVQARAKPVASFAEKAQREEARLGDPLQELRDLCGARIVVQTEDQIREVRAWIERYFEVDASESRVTERPAGPAPGGYPPVRLIARLDRPRAEALTAAVGVEIREEMLGLWAEIEVQTVLEHAWRHVNREMGHDVPLPMPERWSAELRSVGDLLKAVDRSFARIRTGFERYRTTYPAHLGKDELEREIEILANVLACENDARVAVRLGKLAITAGDFGRAIAVLEPHAKAGYPPALRDLGVAICQQQRGSPESAVYERGQAYLEQACAEPHRDPDALCSLAGTWKRRGRHDKALEFYRRALEIDPADPYAVGGVLESELALNRGADIVAALQPSSAGAIERCRDHIAAGVNLPWAYYDLGKFLLLAGQRDDALLVFKRAIDYSTAPFMIQTSLESLDRLAACGEWTGLKEARALLGGSVAS